MAPLALCDECGSVLRRSGRCPTCGVTERVARRSWPASEQQVRESRLPLAGGYSIHENDGPFWTALRIVRERHRRPWRRRGIS